MCVTAATTAIVGVRSFIFNKKDDDDEREILVSNR